MEFMIGNVLLVGGSYILYNDKIYFNGVNFASNLFHDINCEQLKGKFEKITIA